MRTQKIASRPCAGIARRRRRCPRPRPIQTAPSVVNETETVADCRVSAKTTKTKASGRVRREPPVTPRVPPSRPGARANSSAPAEAPAPARVFLEGAREVVRAEVGPERLDEDELRVGELPEQEVGDPELAGGVGCGFRSVSRGSPPPPRSLRAASTISARPP